MTQDGSAPLTRRAAREARRAAADAGSPGQEQPHRTGWQPPLGEPGERPDPEPEGERDALPPAAAADDGAAARGRPAAPDLRTALTGSRERSGTAGTQSQDEPTAAPAQDDPVVDQVPDVPVVLTKDPAVDGTTDRTGAEQELLGRRRRSGGLAQAGAEDFSLTQAVGGVRGAAETLVPGLLFVTTYTLTRDLTVSLAVSVGAAVLAIVLRVVTRSAPVQALSGAVGVAICAVFALLSGEARNFYLPGFLLNVGYGLVCLLSTVSIPRLRVPGTQHHVGPGPYPVIGLLLGPLTGEGLAWRRVPARLRAYRRVTWLWAGFFLLRLAVQVPLYLADLVGALGAARLAMGVPAFALMVWVSWLLLRSVPRALPEDEPRDRAVQQDAAAGGQSAG